MKDVVIATTMWDAVDQQRGIHRLQELQGDFFKDTYDRGVPIMQHDNTRRSAYMILSSLLGKDVTRCDIQYEMAYDGKSVGNTVAGKEPLHQFDEIENTHGKQLKAAQDWLGPTSNKYGLVDGSGGTKEDEDAREPRIMLENVRQELRRVQDERDKLRQILGEDHTAPIKKNLSHMYRTPVCMPDAELAKSLPSADRPPPSSPTPGTPPFARTPSPTPRPPTSPSRSPTPARSPTADGSAQRGDDPPTSPVHEIVLDKEKENVLVIGKTGCGKTTFSNFAADMNLTVGEEGALSPCTTTIQRAEFVLKGHPRPVVLYDVPDVVITGNRQVVSEDRKQCARTAAIYVIDITDKRASSKEENFMVLDNLDKRCLLHKLLILTTMWPEDGPRRIEASQRLDEWRQGLLKKYIRRGASVELFENGMDNQQACSTLRALLASNLAAKGKDAKGIRKSFRAIPGLQNK